MKTGVARDSSLSHEYFVLQINGQTASIHQCYEDAMREGLLLKNRFPHVDIKVCEVDSIEEVAQGTVFHWGSARVCTNLRCRSVECWSPSRETGEFYQREKGTKADRLGKALKKFWCPRASEHRSHSIANVRAHKQEATARWANRRLPVNFKALIRRLTIGGHARQQWSPWRPIWFRFRVRCGGKAIWSTPVCQTGFLHLATSWLCAHF